MRIVFPTDEAEGQFSRRGAHFGKAKYYTIVTLENNVITGVQTNKNQGHSGACGGAVSNIMALEPDALVVSGIGGSPAQGFSDAGLDLYFDQTSPTVEMSVNMLISGKLKKLKGKGTCSGH